MRRLAWFIAAFLIVTAARADVGSAGRPLSSILTSGRGAALGDTGAVTGSGAENVFWNPAAVGLTPGAQTLYLARTFWVQDLNANALALDGTMGPVGVGAGLFYAGAGSIEQTDDAAATVGQLDPRDVAGSVALAVPMGTARVGVAVRYLQSRLLHTAQAASVDLGLRVPAGRRLTFAAAFQGLGQALRYDAESRAPFRTLRGGAEAAVGDRTRLVVEGVAPQGGRAYASGGAEVGVGPASAQRFLLRAGYNGRWADGKDGAAGLTVGFGLSFATWSLDYAWIPLGELGQAQNIALRFPLHFAPRPARPAR